eukprot:gene6445-9864_t
MKGLWGNVSAAGSKTVSGLTGNWKNLKAKASASPDRANGAKRDRSPPPASGLPQAEMTMVQKVEKLVEMGFDLESAKSALILADNDLDTALAFLGEHANRDADDEDDDIQCEMPGDEDEDEDEQNNQTATSQNWKQAADNHFDAMDAIDASVSQCSAASVRAGTEAVPADEPAEGLDQFEFTPAVAVSSMASGPAFQSQPANSPAPVDPFEFDTSPANPPTAVSQCSVASVRGYETDKQRSNPTPTDDTFDFLSPSPASPAPSPTPFASSAPPLTLKSKAPGTAVFRLNTSALPPPPSKANLVSIGVKPQAATTWLHQVDARTGRLIPFSDGSSWEQSCHALDRSEVTIFFGDTFGPAKAFHVCARLASKTGPGAACVAIDLTVEHDIVRSDFNDLDSFLVSSSPSSPRANAPSPSQLKALPVYP